MAWTDTARRQHMRNGPGFQSEFRDEEWVLIVPVFPGARRGGRLHTTCLRPVMNAILYIASGGCAWRDSGLLATINHLLGMTARQQVISTGI